MATPRDKAKRQLRCLCGVLMRLNDGEGTCLNCDRTAEDVREYWRRENAARAERRGTSRELTKRTEQRRVELSKKAIAYAKLYGKPQDDPSADLGPESREQSKHVCAGYPGHKCDVLTANRRCRSCGAKWKSINGVTGDHNHACASAPCHIDQCAFL